MSELTERARSRLTTTKADHEQAMRNLAQVTSDQMAELLHETKRWADRMGQHNEVLETGDAPIGSDGTFNRDFRAPFATIAILNQSVTAMRVAANAGGASPGDGAGSFTVPAGSFGRWPLVGRTMTVYGTVGARLSYSILAAPAPPFASKVV